MKSHTVILGSEKVPGVTTKNTTFMCKIYRSTINIIRFLRTEPLISMVDYASSVGHTTKGPKVRKTVIPVEQKRHQNSKRTRGEIVRELTSRVIQLSTEEGVHPGDVAITYDEYDFQQIFGCRENADRSICCALEESAKAVLRENPKSAPQPSLNVDESVMFSHNKSLTSCECKYFIGPFRKIKGLTVKVVIYLSIQGSSRGHNRLAAYTSLTRSSCLVEMLYIQVKSMRMVNYQIKKYDNTPMRQNFSVRKPSGGKVFHVTGPCHQYNRFSCQRLQPPWPRYRNIPEAIDSTKLMLHP